MNLFMDKEELESLTGLKNNRLYLVCPNGMILVFDLDEIFLVSKFLRFLEIMDSNIHDNLDILNFDLNISDNKEFKSFTYDNRKIDTYGDLVDAAGHYPFGLHWHHVRMVE